MTRKRLSNIVRALFIDIVNTSCCSEKDRKAYNRKLYTAQFRLTKPMMELGCKSYRQLYNECYRHAHEAMIERNARH